MKNHRSFLAAFLFIIIFFFSFAPSNSFSQTPDSLKSTISFQWGNSIWSNTLSLGYDYSFSKHFHGGLSFGKGFFQYNSADASSSYFFDGPPGRDRSISIDFKQMLDLRIGYIIKPHDGIRFFNKFEAGVSYSRFVFESRFVGDDNYQWIARKNYVLYSLLLSADIFDYNPHFEKHLGFELGIKSRFTMTDNTMLLVYENSYGKSIVWNFWRYPNEDSKIYWAYPELFIKINYAL